MQRCVLGIEKRYSDHIAIGMRHVCLFIPRPVSSIHTRSLQFSMLTNCWNIISIWTNVMLTLLYIIMTIRNTIVFFLYKTDKGQSNVIIAISHNTKPPKSYKYMLTRLIFILILFPISICQQKHRDVTYFHNNSQVCHITLNVRVVVHVRKTDVHVIKSNVISFLLS